MKPLPRFANTFYQLSFSVVVKFSLKKCRRTISTFFFRHAEHRRQPTFRSDVAVAADVGDDEDADAKDSAGAAGRVGAEAPGKEVDE